MRLLGNSLRGVGGWRVCLGQLLTQSRTQHAEAGQGLTERVVQGMEQTLLFAPDEIGHLGGGALPLEDFADLGADVVHQVFKHGVRLVRRVRKSSSTAMTSRPNRTGRAAAAFSPAFLASCPRIGSCSTRCSWSFSQTGAPSP